MIFSGGMKHAKEKSSQLIACYGAVLGNDFSGASRELK